MNNLGEDALGVTYRAATPEDAGGISELVINLFEEFIFHEYSDEGKARIVRDLSPELLAKTISGGNIVYLAESERQLVGVVSIRNKSHLSLNFVNADFHRRGISQELWKRGRNECVKRGNPGRFTLNASTYAIQVYEKWGFVRTGEANRAEGILSHPMVLEV